MPTVHQLIVLLSFLTVTYLLSIIDLSVKKLVDVIHPYLLPVAKILQSPVPYGVKCLERD